MLRVAVSTRTGKSCQLHSGSSQTFGTSQHQMARTRQVSPINAAQSAPRPGPHDDEREKSEQLFFIQLVLSPRILVSEEDGVWPRARVLQKKQFWGFMCLSSSIPGKRGRSQVSTFSQHGVLYQKMRASCLRDMRSIRRLCASTALLVGAGIGSPCPFLGFASS